MRSSSVDHLAVEVKSYAACGNLNGSYNSLVDMGCSPKNIENSGYCHDDSIRSANSDVYAACSNKKKVNYKPGYSYSYQQKIRHSVKGSRRESEGRKCIRNKSNAWELYTILHGDPSGKFSDQMKKSSGMVQGGSTQSGKRECRLQSILGNKKLDTAKKLHQLYAIQGGKSTNEAS